MAYKKAGTARRMLFRAAYKQKNIQIFRIEKKIIVMPKTLVNL